MNRRLFNILMTCAVAVFSLSCNQENIAPDTPDVPDTPDAPTEGYHLTFDGGVGIKTGTRAVWNDDNGSGNLIFQWDYTPEGTEDYEMVMAIVGGELVKSIEGNYHTYASIHRLSEHSDDAHWATFKTIETYPYDITGGKYVGFDVLAVTPICDANGATVSSNNLDFDVTMPMPATFTQVADQKPDFLRNYMYMCASETIFDNMATLRFKHIPATFRFIITNKRPTQANIKSVTVSLTDVALPVASKSASINFAGELTFSEDTHTAITTQLGENGTTVQKDAKYTAYALALPLADNNAFKDKKIQFTIEALGPDNEHLSFELDADKLAAANPDNEYNWVGGKSYTVRMSLDDGLLVQDITVDDWNEQEIVGGEATEALSSINATAMTPDKLNAAVTKALEEGETDITVTLKPDAPVEMITAIRRAICDTDGVADSSIHLTLKGVTTIPGTTNWDGVAFGPRNAQWDENNVEIVSHEEVTQLASVNLPDVTEIGAQAFYFCENLVTVSAPKAQTIGAQALGYTALTSVEFPELTTIPTDMFSGTWTLSSAKFPKVTTIEQGGLLVGAKFWPENNPTPFPLELTAEGDITFNGSNHFNIASQNYSGKVDLVLNIDKKDQVTLHDDGTATWQVRDDLSYTFKSITFVGD